MERAIAGWRESFAAHAARRDPGAPRTHERVLENGSALVQHDLCKFSLEILKVTFFIATNRAT
jgi:hypothetical protein